jgi:acyl-coenzyme A thioesterase PaaI-like protein
VIAAPDGLLPVMQANVARAFDWIFAPWVKEMGFADFVVREGFASIRLPLQDKLKFFSGAMCGHALMASMDTAASLAFFTMARSAKGTVYQHTHYLRPALNDDVRTEAKVLRFGKSTAYVECHVTYATSGGLLAHGVLEFAF